MNTESHATFMKMPSAKQTAEFYRGSVLKEDNMRVIRHPQRASMSDILTNAYAKALTDSRKRKIRIVAAPSLAEAMEIFCFLVQSRLPLHLRTIADERKTQPKRSVFCYIPMLAYVPVPSTEAGCLWAETTTAQIEKENTIPEFVSVYCCVIGSGDPKNPSMLVCMLRTAGEDE